MRARIATGRSIAPPRNVIVNRARPRLPRVGGQRWSRNDGAASDLRTGLPWQMVEIHEPVRSLFVIETTPTAMLGIIDKNAGIGQMCKNGWIQLVVLDPSEFVAV